MINNALVSVRKPKSSKRTSLKINMKNIILCTFLVTICLLVEAQGPCKDFQGRDISVGTHYIDCKQITCHPDGHVTGLPCPVYQCAKGKLLGYREEDLSKPYPECCAGPICKD